MGLGLKGRKVIQICKNYLSVSDTSFSAVFFLTNVEGWNSPVGVWDGAHRSRDTRLWCRAANSRGPLDYSVALHYRRTSNQTRAPWISRKGLLRRTRLLQLLRKGETQEFPPGGTHSQTITAQTCRSCPRLRCIRAALPVQLTMRGAVMWF